MSTSRLLAEVKEANEDFEWYPTTDAILNVIKNSLNVVFKECDRVGNYSILDCGAGDGRALKALQNGKMYAIEKSKPLLNALDKKIFVVGTEFKEQTLIDKRVDAVFSNPPYSEFAEWTLKIIKEARAAYIYLVIPSRWETNELIQEAIKRRDGEATVLGSFDFMNAERKARAKVDIVKIKLCHGRESGYHNSKHGSKTDPFTQWFNDSFEVGAQKRESSDYELNARNRNAVKDATENAVVNGRDVVTVLEELYQFNLNKLIGVYKSLETIDSDLLQEMNINLEGVCNSLQLKITNLKDIYWHELFNNLDKVTNRLTEKSRKRLLDVLTEHTHIDFTASNAYAVLIWVIKNANEYFDDQLIETVERMIHKANIVNYKSNQRTFGNEEWRYNHAPKDLEKFSLDLRVVLERVGGIDMGYWREKENGLEERAANFLEDLRTIASNIGFDTNELPSIRSMSFESGKSQRIMYKDHVASKEKVLFEAKAFKNGNMHIKFNPAFICKLNVEFGRLKGWIKSPKEAAEEMNVDFKVAAESFKSNIKLEGSNVLRLDFKRAS